MKLYFPTSSLNLNDIFATESISPKAFYSRRTYGTKRHFITELAPDEFNLTWYVEMPMFELIYKNTSDYEEYPIIIERECDPENEGFFKSGNDSYVTIKTVYFTTTNTRFYFFSDNALSKVLQKSKVVEETKLVQKYRNNLLLISPESLVPCKIPEINHLSDENQLESMIIEDKFFNHLKGFVYAWISKAWLPEHNKFEASNRLLENLKVSLSDLLDNSQKLNGLDIVSDLLKLADKYTKEFVVFPANIEDIFPIEFIKGMKTKIKSLMCSNAEELRAFEVLINTILQNPKSKVGEIKKEELDMLIQTLDENLEVVFGNNSFYKSDIDAIQNRLQNRIYEIEIEHLKTNVLKNFLVFIMKYDNVEEMERFIQIKNIKKDFMSYSFLGAFMGFSGLSRKVTCELLDSGNQKLLFQIDKELSSIKRLDVTKNNQIVPLKKEPDIPLQSAIAESSHKEQNYDLFNFNHVVDEDIEIEKQIFHELIRIRKPSFIQEYLTQSGPTVLENEMSVVFELSQEGIKIRLYNAANNYFVLLKEKESTTESQYREFKLKLKDLGLSSSFCQGKYSVFSYGRNNVNKLQPLYNLELQNLLVSLKLII